MKFSTHGLAVLTAAAIALAAFGAPEKTLVDPMRPVTRVTPDSFTIQYFTAQPCPTRVQIRRGSMPATVRKWAGVKADAWAESGVRVVDAGDTPRTFHTATIDGLDAGARYYYRVFDPGSTPTREELDWAAAPPWRREHAISTLGGPGRRTVIHYPVKVLLMTNVINVESAYDESGKQIAPHPEKFSEAQLDLVRRELDTASRFFWINSGMRFWVDFHVFVDDRWERWGPEPKDVDAFYAGWPQCRSYAGEDYHSPGGGRFTIVDTKNVDKTNEEPLVESPLFPSQIEIAFPRKWRPKQKEWWYYTSGGGTLGPDSLPHGVPGRSQFFGGYDTAWLATHEFHHQMEALGSISFSNREDDRIVYDHWAPRSRTRGPDAASGKEGVHTRYPWTSSARHGEHYDGISYWDRTVTGVQWLRIILGDTITVVDTDGDGLPDDDPRLPLDEKRFGSDPTKASTDGKISDFDKLRLYTWAPAPLQVSFTKPQQVFDRPDPTSPDSDGDGWDDGVDPDPLVPNEPFVWPMTASVDGDASEWANIPESGRLAADGSTVVFKQAHDGSAYYGLITCDGPFRRIRVVQDDEGKGVYSGEGVQSFFINNGDTVKVAPTFMGVTPDMKWSAKRDSAGRTVVEWSFTNWAPKGWYWRGGGREVGTYVELYKNGGPEWSMYPPYHIFYARMLDRKGRAPMPPNPPQELTAQDADIVLKPGDDRLKTTGNDWKIEDGALHHTGFAESAVYIDGLDALQFDLWIRFEAKSDGILGAFTPDAKSISAMQDYIAFIGGYSNTRSRLRLYGEEAGDGGVMMSPGVHTMQLSRRNGVVWTLFDGKPVLWAKDPHPDKAVNRLAALGGYGGRQVIHEMRIRVVKSAPPSTPGADHVEASP